MKFGYDAHSYADDEYGYEEEEEEEEGRGAAGGDLIKLVHVHV